LEQEVFTGSTTYDALNRPTAVIAPDQSVYRPTFNEANLLEKVKVNLRGASVPTPFVTDIDYDAKGQRVLIEYGNGVRTNYEYDPLTFRLTHLKTLRGAERLQDLGYTYDPVGNITHIQDDAQQTIYFNNQVVEPHNDYVYDAIYRLIHAEGREHIGQVSQPETTWNDEFRIKLQHPQNGQAMRRYIERYEYDAVGNFLQLIHQATNGNWKRGYAYNEPSLIEPTKQSNRLSSTTIGSGNPEFYAYDAHGNMTAMPHLPSMHWDYRDELEQVDMGGGGTAYYVYDAGGQRVRKVIEKNGGTLIEERLYLGGFEIFRHRNVSGTVTLERETLHIMDDKQRLALVETRTQGNDGSPAQLIRYQFSNHLGSASLELDDVGQIISYEEYYAYGSTSYQAVRSQTETRKRYRYTGIERDEESGLKYHSARYYASWLGKWLTVEPLLLSGGKDFILKYSKWEPYCYAFRNPLKYLDPSGKENVVVVGSEYRKGAGSKLQFVHQGIRRIKEYESEEPNETRTMVLFSEGYTSKQIRTISDALKKHNAGLIAVDSIEEFANYVNHGISVNLRDKDKITGMDFFSHGTPGSIRLGYHTRKENEYELTMSTLNKFAKEAFDQSSIITSYACRTAWSDENVSVEDGIRKSLARQMGIVLQTNVRAYAIRTDYVDTLGSRSDRALRSWNLSPDLEESLKRRIQVDGATFDPEGALRPVKAESPDDRPEGFVSCDQFGECSYARDPSDDIEPPRNPYGPGHDPTRHVNSGLLLPARWQ
jgi:RHS repeat-associated protein